MNLSPADLIYTIRDTQIINLNLYDFAQSKNTRNLVKAIKTGDEVIIYSE